METQLDEQFVFSGEGLFEKSDKNFKYVDGSSLPELKLKDGETVFPDNLTSTNNSGHFVSHLSFLTDPLSTSLPDIESSFAPTSSQNPQQCVPPRFHPYGGSLNIRETEHLPEFHQPVFHSTINAEGYKLYQPVTKESQFDTHLEPAIDKNSTRFVDTSQAHWSNASTTQYVMNSNNNNINQLVSYNGMQTVYQATKLQCLHRAINHIHPSFQPHSDRFPGQGIPKRERITKEILNDENVGQSRPRETILPTNCSDDVNLTRADLIGAKFSPERKNRTKRRKKRSPNEPQKPVSAYALFFRDTQANIKADNPSATFGEISKIVASMWDSLSDTSKQTYKQKTETAKRDYLKQLAAYRANLISKGGLDVEGDEHRSSNFQMFKNNQRSSSNSYHASPSKIREIPQKMVRDIHPSRIVFDIPHPPEQQKHVDINIVCEGRPATSSYFEIPQHSNSVSQFMIHPGADNVPSQE